MDQKAFVESEPGSWWFFDPSTDTPWFEGRRALVEPRGWQEPDWLKDQTKVEELYKAIETQAPQLLRDLDDLIDTDEAKVAWIASVRTLLVPQVVPSASAPARGSANDQGPAATPGAPAPAEAPKKKGGLFAKRTDIEEPAEPGRAPESVVVPAHVTQGVEQIIKSLSGEGSSELGDELGISEEQMAELANDPDFERMVHEEVARLHQANS